MTMVSLSDALALERVNEGSFTATFTKDWSQGRAVFGGLVASAGVKAMQALVDDERTPRTILVNFAGPVTPGEEVHIEAEVLRSGKSLTTAMARLVQDGSVRTTVQVGFGEDRPSAARVESAVLGDVAGPEELPELPFIEGMTPTFIKHVDWRWTTANFPGMGGDEAKLSGWCRFRDEATPIGLLNPIALMDAWPSPILSVVSGKAFASSITWMLNIVEDPGELAGDPQAWWFYRAEVSAARAGYAESDAELYSSDGRLIATGRQLVAEFSAK